MKPDRKICSSLINHDLTVGSTFKSCSEFVQNVLNIDEICTDSSFKGPCLRFMGPDTLYSLADAHKSHSYCYS